MNDPLERVFCGATDKGIPHLILYGDVASISPHIWERIHGSPVTLQESHYESFTYRNHAHLYEIDTPTITQGVCPIFVKWFTHMFVKGGFYRDKQACLIWNSFETVRPLVQDVLRVLLETSHHTACIFLTNNYTSISPPLQSRCVSIRIPYLSSDTLYLSPSRHIATRILDIYAREESLMSFHHSSCLKEYATTIMKYDLDVSELFRYLVEGITGDARYPHVVKYNVVEYLATQEHIYRKGYMKLVWMEGILCTIDYLLFTAHYKVDGNKKEQINILLDKARPQENDKQKKSHIHI